jgi:hypothetical protein|tara:strand:- start:406 stop:1287 length:882 start_codon:yes stop_codon:yes gene_type:complete
MATQTIEQVQRLSPYLEGLEKRLLQSAFGEFDGEDQTTPGLLDTALNLPEYQVAGLDPLQQAAQQQALRQFGLFQPFVQTAGQLATSGIAQGLGMLDPQKGVQSYMNPYQDAVIDEINRQADIGQNKLAGQAIGSGAFGGSRAGVQAAEMEGRRLGKIGEFLSKGFDTAVGASQKAAQLFGGLGQAASGIGDIGRLQSELGRADIGMLSQLGGIGQRQSQAQLDAQRQNLMQGIMEPFTRLELGSSLLKGTPSGSLSSTFRSATTPGANPFLQGVGAYTALQGAGMGGGTVGK